MLNLNVHVFLESSPARAVLISREYISDGRGLIERTASRWRAYYAQTNLTTESHY